MVVKLPKIKLGRKTYFIDERLGEMRNIKNPHDAIRGHDYNDTMLAIRFAGVMRKRR